ncbi:MAG TPA: alpha/beta fold hydrolase [Hyphomonadaceae bacterium]|jgi:pimeloyl-ACP methyl ester carboxylesterase|nr:alpha/beta fold hydrolase [Hyphomonadaceae bacterium]
MKRFIRIVLGVVAAAAVALFVAWLVLRRDDIPYATLEKTYAHPADAFVELKSGVRVHYRIEGKADGETILLLHGIGGDLDVWSGWVGELGAQYRIVSIDLPGHGLTRAPEGYEASIPGFVEVVEEFVQAAGISRFALGGSSMGGNVAWLYARQHPERLDALVLVDAAGWRAPRGGVKSALYGMVATSPVGGVIASLDPKLVLGSATGAAGRDADLARAPGHRRILLSLFLKRGEDANATAGRVAGITAPTLILWGGKDNVIAPADAGKFAAAIPGAKVVTFPAAGHLPHKDVARESAAAVAEFLGGLTRRP